MLKRCHLTLVLAVLAFAIAPAPVTAIEPFPPVTNLQACFVPGRNLVQARWDQVEGAETYTVKLITADGRLVARSRTRRGFRNFPSTLFTMNRTYYLVVRVNAAATGTASPRSRVRYTYAPALEEMGTLEATNASGRHGTYFLPKGFNGTPLPVMVAYHGTGGSGEGMVNAFLGLARSRGFIIVAPDSRQSPSGQWTWEVGNRPGEVTPDFTFTQECVGEVLSRPGVMDDPARWIAVGFSGGGSSAPYFATNDSRLGKYGVLHGGAFAGGLGSNVIPGWFSTGTDDTIREPWRVMGDAASVEALGFPVVYREFPGGHTLGDEEKKALVLWWLE